MWESIKYMKRRISFTLKASNWFDETLLSASRGSEQSSFFFLSLLSFCWHFYYEFQSVPSINQWTRHLLKRWENGTSVKLKNVKCISYNLSHFNVKDKTCRLRILQQNSLFLLIYCHNVLPISKIRWLWHRKSVSLWLELDALNQPVKTQQLMKIKNIVLDVFNKVPFSFSLICRFQRNFLLMLQFNTTAGSNA